MKCKHCGHVVSDGPKDLTNKANCIPEPGETPFKTSAATQGMHIVLIWTANLKLCYCFIHNTVATPRGDLKRRHNGRTSINSQEGARPSLGVVCDSSKLEYFISEHKLILLPINQSTNTM